ncbi:hypothetical protein GTY65_04315 [Streptomyces sp. SID8379]|uniref:hypothetical protein n=1 Tax=unclassified Streptomyces TaxID=2593676 RepID=UPI0007C56AA5|nr:MULTISPECIES: hypothetical protein [unclassified Streptomyces]MYW63306.1 hypothetical protein [Streptomyces sp. SID8379]
MSLSPRSERRSIAMHAGLLLTALTALAPLLDIATVDTLSAHVRDAYPGWGPHDVAADRNAIAGYLVGTGALGTLLWLLAVRGITTGRRWARTATTLGFTAGLSVALLNLGLRGEKYDVVVPYAYGTATFLPCVAGAVVVVSVWRRRPVPKNDLTHSIKEDA